MDLNMQGKVALVTGGSKGREGHRVRSGAGGLQTHESPVKPGRFTAAPQQSLVWLPY
jgi:hypothetical protein